MASSLSMAGSDSGGLDGCKVYSGVSQYGSRLSLETFPRVLPGRRWVCPVRGYALSITAICSSCQIEIATVRFVNAAAEYFKEPFRRELRIQPVGGAIGITADILVDGVAAQHAV